MSAIFTCPNCQRQYSVANPGDYVCECGYQYCYPVLFSTTAEHYTVEAPQYIDSSSRSFKRDMFYSRTRSIRHLGRSECFTARASFVCGILGLVFFGLLSIPALILGLVSLFLIANPNKKYRGLEIAISGISLAILGILCWGYLLMSFLNY